MPICLWTSHRRSARALPVGLPSQDGTSFFSKLLPSVGKLLASRYRPAGRVEPSRAQRSPTQKPVQCPFSRKSDDPGFLTFGLFFP